MLFRNVLAEFEESFKYVSILFAVFSFDISFFTFPSVILNF